MRFLLKLVLNSLAVIITANLLDGVQINSAWSAILVSAVLAFLNAIVKPLLILFTIPVTILSLGLFLLVINAIIIVLADSLVDGFQVNGFLTAFWFSLVLSIINWVLESISGLRSGENQEGE